MIRALLMAFVVPGSFLWGQLLPPSLAHKLETGQFAEAAPGLRQAWQQTPTASQRNALLGEVLPRAATGGALGEFARWLGKGNRQDDPVARYWLSLVEMRLMRLRRAASLLQSLAAADPASPVLNGKLAELAARRFQPARAAWFAARAGPQQASFARRQRWMARQLERAAQRQVWLLLGLSLGALLVLWLVFRWGGAVKKRPAESGLPQASWEIEP